MLDWNALPQPVVGLSPMADLTDSACCRLAKRRGCALVWREMVSAEAVVRGNRKTLGMAALHAEERPLVQQVFGGDPVVVAAAVRLLDEAHDPDAFDLNMGCPARKIVGGGGGSDLLRQPELASRIVRAAKEATGKPVSVKTRLGWSRADEILEFIKVLEAAGADLVAVHGRTKEQGYAGRADWSMVGRAKRQVRIPVLVNGDVVSGATARAALDMSGCDGLLIGRAALGNPWIFDEVAAALAERPYDPPDLAERLDTIREHACLHADLYGGEQPLITFHKHLTCYFRGWPGARAWRPRLVRISTLEELETVLREVWEQSA